MTSNITLIRDDEELVFITDGNGIIELIIIDDKILNDDIADIEWDRRFY